MSGQGVGGETSTQIAARAGAVPTTITLTGNSLPSAGTVAGTTSTGVPSAQGGALGATVAGMPVTLTYSSGQVAQRREAAASPTPVPAGTGVVFDAAGALAWWRQIIWIGRNDYPRTSVPAQVAAIIAQGKTGKYLVLSVLNSAGDNAQGYADVLACNATLAATYGARYLDVRTYLVQHGLADAGITPTTQDLADIANDLIPTSLRADAVHLLAAGYTIVAQQVKAKLQALGWA